VDAAQPRPRIGDLVQLGSRRRVVTDIRHGTYVVRPLCGGYTETPVEDPDMLKVLARRGTWGP